jgi:hypothetical protein
MDKFISNVLAFDVNATLRKVWENPRVEAEIVRLNSIEQLYNKGERADGVSLGEYSPVTIQLKLNGQGDRRVDHVTLKDTGEFYGSMEVMPNEFGFEITADTIKENDDLIDKYGAQILGLSPENLDKLAEFITPYFVEEAKKVLYS